MNEITTFEGQEVKVKTDKGVTLINLAHTAKCCGLIREDRGYSKVRWIDIKNKLKLIGKNCVDEGSSKEIQYILDEIENTDDRNTIYMSGWLSKRLALECHSEKAMRYKNFLVTLDETREQGQLQSVSQETVLQLAQGMQMIGQVVQGMQTAMTNIETYVKDSIQSKDLQIEKTMNLIGFRSINTKRLSDKLKEQLSEHLGIAVNASSNVYRRAKGKIFKEFKVIKWEDIPVSKYNTVHAFIEEVVCKNI
ncbi:hypothetical protein [Clostridium botulinum]|uniref:Antirepressor n=1 Tax=Clostridium botulinum CFSAN001627 TaxID=1232189 RepID=M1ZVR0_CLOBO|nr:hypothetical protein [Clostridium botulinum]EKN40878.1 antirepressor [Clostridium botulinum CFSAN001627]APC85819.1 hypothetical protein NPD12_1462 [Clostridium botulinum]AXG95379.1 hypothetical protein AGE31_06695 [Clostridium botulinum]EDT82510.1 putative antirepressor [Clostridium botulinum NCTC 2916]MBY6770518.1 hypothetical protein [Clostridium botulinum]